MSITSHTTSTLKLLQTQVQTGDSGRGLVVQDVNAPTHVVWDRILDYDNYSNMVPKTVESKNYKVIPHKPTKANNFLEKEIFTRMKVGFPMLKLEFFVRHFIYIQHHNSLTWTLDYTKESDFDDSAGYWFILPHPDDPEEKTRLYYSVQVSMFDWVPKFVVDFMSSKALTDATAWVKKYSEIEWAKELEMGGGRKTNPAENSRGNGKSIFSYMTPFGKKKKEEEERLAAEAAATRLALEEQEAQKKRSLIRIRAGWRRYVLVSMVFTLVVYNVALLFRNDEKSS